MLATVLYTGRDGKDLYLFTGIQVRPQDALRDPALLPEREEDRLGAWPSPAWLRRSGKEAAKAKVFRDELLHVSDFGTTYHGFAAALMLFPRAPGHLRWTSAQCGSWRIKLMQYLLQTMWTMFQDSPRSAEQPGYASGGMRC